MTTAIELANQRKVELSYLQTVGQVLADSHYFNDAHTAQQAVAKILAGQEFGMGVMEAMRSFHVIDGKVEMSADTQARLVKASSKYDYAVIELTDEACEIQFFADDLGEIGNSRFTMTDAERAGIVKNEGAWKKYPRNMLFARALTNGVAWFCPDAISGGRVYAPGEVSGEVWNVPTSEVSVELEPGVSHTGGSAAGMGEADGEVDGANSIFGASSAEPDGSTGIVEDAPADPEPVGPEAGAAAASDAGGGSAVREGTAPALLSSQAKQLLRHAADLRWKDADISAAVAEAYPGLGAIGDLSQEQARALIPEWAKLVKATRIQPEQRERLKALATTTDVVRRAQVLFDADYVKNIGDLTIAEAEALISDLEAVREEQEVPR